MKIHHSSALLIFHMQELGFFFSADFQVHQFQQDHDPAVLDTRTLRQGSTWIRRHVLHHLLGFHPARIFTIWNPSQGFQQFRQFLVSELC